MEYPGLIFFLSCVSAFMAWIWIDYFRQIDVFEKEDPVALVFVFLAGGASVLLVELYHMYLWPSIGCELNGHFINDFLFCFLNIGLVEELSKMTPFLLFLIFFRKQLNEPLDFVIYASLTSLGFSAVENVLYFYRYGFFIFDIRAIWCSVAHMFFGAVFAYGFVLVVYRKLKPAILIIPLFILLAALMHGIYDFILMYDKIESFIFILSPLFYFCMVSFFAIILNNALNNSSFYVDKLAVDSDRVSDRLLTYYLVVFGIQFLLFWLYWGIDDAVGYFIIKLFMTGSIILIVCIRLSRLKIIPGRWYPFKIEMPFGFFARETFIDAQIRQYDLRIKGSSYNETRVLKCLHQQSCLISLDEEGLRRYVFVGKKDYFSNDDIYFIAEIQTQVNSNLHGPEVLLKPKIHGKKFIKGVPIVGVFDFSEVKKSGEKIASVKQLRFLGWAKLLTVGEMRRLDINSSNG